MKTCTNIHRTVLLCSIASMSIFLMQSGADAAMQKSSESFASWYRVPPKSLARARAARGEYTAAHNQLPIGTLVRVTRLSNGHSVVVRITDRGVTNRPAKIDICREAAQELDMIHTGVARVRLEVVSGPGMATATESARTAQ